MSQQLDPRGSTVPAHGEGLKQKRPFHRDWRIWAAVGLMLGCMVIYLLTLDESLVPGGAPAAAKPQPTNAAPAVR